jgi:hypothetical protein
MDRLPLVPPASAPRAPPWQVERWFGPPTSLDELAGKVIVLHAFQMLCPGCVLHGLPQAASIRRAFDPEDVAVVGLHSVFEHHEAMTPTSLAAFLHEFRVSIPVAVDVPGAGRPVPRTMESYQLRGTPSLVLIDRQGRLRANVFGRPADLAVGAAIATLVGENRGQQGVVASEGKAGCDDDGCAVPEAS